MMELLVVWYGLVVDVIEGGRKKTGLTRREEGMARRGVAVL